MERNIVQLCGLSKKLLHMMYLAALICESRKYFDQAQTLYIPSNVFVKRKILSLLPEAC